VGSPFAPLCLLFDSVLFPGVQIPLCFFFFLSGRSTILMLCVWMAIQAMAAVGLLKLKNWGRLTVISLQCFGLLNTALMFGIPANRARFQLVVESVAASMNTSMSMPQSVPLSFPMWIGLAASIPIFLVILWFLVRQKQAFTPTTHELASPSA
jgi:hypothetical protein